MHPSHSFRSWIVALAATGFGLGAYFYDNHVKDNAVEGSRLKAVLSDVELLIMGPGMGILGYVTMENLRLKDDAHSRNLEQERRQRFLQLGQIAASMAHEIRNPLQNLRLINEELRVTARDGSGRLLDRLDANLTRLDFAVKLAYELSRPQFAIEEGDELELVPIVVSCLLEITPQAQTARRITHQPPAEPVLVAARLQGLRIVLDNILRNAIQADAQQPITIHYLTSPGHWELEIINAGTIPQAVISGDQAIASTKPNGIGVGVSIARQLARNVGGDLSYRNADGQVHTLLRLRRLELAVAELEPGPDLV